MREISLNGYIDDEEYFGDEITPGMLHDLLYEPGPNEYEDVHIRLNSYGGSCNAAVRMHDELTDYPGRVIITVSGTVASAATVLAMAADYLEMTSGSLWMIHDPSMLAVGNEHDLNDAIALLRACKESIINVYRKRCRMGHDEISDMMTKTTWMDSQTAMSNGFIDSVVSGGNNGIVNAISDRVLAEKMVQNWADRHKARRPDASEDMRCEKGAPMALQEKEPQPAPADEKNQIPEETGTPVSQLYKRLALIMPTRRT